jgi:2,5-diketo-D-gluconate reductase B
MSYETAVECTQSVETALELGYRHIDTAQKYENERAVGNGIENSAVPRDDVFLATKIAESNLASDDVFETAAASLDRLGVETVDLLYIHWPAVTYKPQETLEAFNELLADEITRHVGLANFSPTLIDEAREILDEPPIAVQVEMHPLCQQRELRSYVRDHDIQLVSYCPLMRGELFDQPELQKLADKAGISVPELNLAWLISKERVTAIPKATGEAHLQMNAEATTINLSDDIIDRIDAIDRTQRVVDPPEKGPWNW